MKKFGFNEEYRNYFRKKYHIDGKFVIGHVGRFSHQKNHQKLIDIFDAVRKRIPDSELILIGDGELKAEIEQTVKNKKLNVLFMGLTDEVDKWLQVMDMMVFPSLFEGLPLGIIEAQAAGLPCILSDKISPMTAITDLIHFVDLNASAEIWADKVVEVGIKDRLKEKEKVASEIKNSHFDIYENCMQIEDKYINMIKERYQQNYPL